MTAAEERARIVAYLRGCASARHVDGGRSEAQRYVGTLAEAIAVGLPFDDDADEPAAEDVNALLLRHREHARAEERAKIVAYLRSSSERHVDGGEAAREIADAIESGAHGRS